MPDPTIIDYRKLSDDALEEIRDAYVRLSESDRKLVDAELNFRISKHILDHTRYAVYAGVTAAIVSTLAFIYSIIRSIPF